MTYQKSFNTRKKSGIILVDVLLAITLSAVFVALITQSTIQTRNIFEYAVERKKLLAIYQVYANEFIDLVPFQAKNIDIDGTTSVTIRGNARWYGNERIQTDVTLSSVSSTSSLYRSPYSQSVTFSSVKMNSFENTEDVIGTALCSVDFEQKDPVGSYSFLERIRTHMKLTQSSPVLTSIPLPVRLSLPLTDIEVRNGIAYVSADSTIASDSDFLIFNIKDTENVQLLSSIHTGPGIAAFTLAGKKIFAAAASTAAQLHVIRIDSLNSLSLDIKYQLPLPYATATPPMGSSIKYDKKYIYLGTQKWDGDEFSILNVNDPAQPVKIGGLEAGTKINDIAIHNSYAYIAASDQNQLRIADIASKENPRITDVFSPTGWERQEGKVLSLFEDEVSLGRTAGGFNIKKDHELFSWSSSTQVYNSEPIFSLDAPGGIYGLIVDRYRVFIATRQNDGEVHILSKSLSTGTMRTVALPVSPQAMTCDGKELYILGNSAAMIYKLTFK